MGCFKPLDAQRLDDGSVSFSAPKGSGNALTIPCGRCIGCRMDRAKMWAIRCMHEASLYERNCFVTLTFNEDHLPLDGSLKYRDFQLFMKRLRKRFKGIQPVTRVPVKKIRNRFGTVVDVIKLPAITEYPIRFYMCGEYGEKDARPHFHALLFNFDFDDRTLWKKTESGSMIYRSAALEELWPFGYSSIGDVTLQSAGYVARYVMKKMTGDFAKRWYERVNPHTGELIRLTPEFNCMSLKPGIGQAWFDKFYADVYPQDAVVLEGGRKMKPPKFYDLKYEELDPYKYEEVKMERVLRALSRPRDDSPERLAVKEEVLAAQIKKLERSL